MADPSVPAVEAEASGPDTETPETPEIPDDDGDDDLPDAEDVPQAEVSLDDDDVEGGLFSGVEDAEETPDDGEVRDPAEFADEDVLPGGMDEPDLDAPSLSDSEVAAAINEGAARLAVVGLDDDEKAELEDEFAEVFEAFRLGHFGGEVADEYLMPAGDDVDPIWGFASAMAACAVFALYMRPDRDEQMEKIAAAVGGIGGEGGEFL